SRTSCSGNGAALRSTTLQRETQARQCSIARGVVVCCPRPAPRYWVAFGQRHRDDRAPFTVAAEPSGVLETKGTPKRLTPRCLPSPRGSRATPPGHSTRRDRAPPAPHSAARHPEQTARHSSPPPAPQCARPSRARQARRPGHRAAVVVV